MTLIVLPGASLMQIRRLTDTKFLIRCPGCGEENAYDVDPSQAAVFHAFAHDGNCPVLRQIEQVLGAGYDIVNAGRSH